MALSAATRGQLLENVPLADYTSWRVGGIADRLYLPADLADMQRFLPTLPAAERLVCLGLGSNVLVRDSGIRGTVIITQGHLIGLTLIDELTVRAEAGVACPALARFCARAGLSNLEFLAGIPGTVGGALAMNGGCHGGETWDHVIAVETLDRQGNQHLRYPNEYEVGYRHVRQVAGEYFSAAHFRLQPGNKETSLDCIRQLLARRAATQPTSEPSCGSVFRNPPNDYAARLIEACGLKDKCIGGARVSPKHANFIVNDGTANATDIETLIDLVATEVKHRHNIELIREVQIWGDK
jgi:UDP-N-acetylmuramate dehydrogenase